MLGAYNGERLFAVAIEHSTLTVAVDKSMVRLLSLHLA